MEYLFWWDNQIVWFHKKNMDKPCLYKKISGSGFVFLILYVENILLIKKMAFLYLG